MQFARPVGREAASRKYDILSALMAFALSKDKYIQRQILRVMALITTRYNWQRDELTMGQSEIARLWSVDDRTVKREMARFRSQGWLVLKRQGVRGRVSTYGIDLNRMLADTRAVWPLIGEDFETRLEPAAPTGQGTSNVVPLRAMPAPAADGRGRPSSEDKSQVVSCRLPAEEFGAFDALCTQLGAKSRSDGVRSIVRMASGFLEFSREGSARLEEIRCQLGKVGTNVNQIALAANRGRAPLVRAQWTAVEELRQSLPLVAKALNQIIAERRRRGFALFRKFAEAQEGARHG